MPTKIDKVTAGLAIASAVSIGALAVNSVSVQPAAMEGDANGDGVVDFNDIVSVLSNWSAGGAPPPMRIAPPKRFFGTPEGAVVFVWEYPTGPDVLMYSFDTLERIYIALGITPGSIEQVGYIEPKPGDPNAPVVEIVP